MMPFMYLLEWDFGHNPFIFKKESIDLYFLRWIKALVKGCSESSKIDIFFKFIINILY